MVYLYLNDWIFNINGKKDKAKTTIIPFYFCYYCIYLFDVLINTYSSTRHIRPICPSYLVSTVLFSYPRPQK